MRKDKNKAVALRQSGKSYKEIRKSLGVPLGTLSYWFKDELWSQKIEGSLASKKIDIKDLHRMRRDKLATTYAQARAEAEREFRFFKNSALFLAGLVAYWSEGDKTSPYSCRFSSSEPGKIRLFITFLTAVCNIPPQKLTASLLLYPGMDEEECLAHWQAKTGLKQGYFRKTMVAKGRNGSKRIPYGICAVTVSSRYLKEKMIVWLRLIGGEFANLRP